jgi:hypothetical protein
LYWFGLPGFFMISAAPFFTIRSSARRTALFASPVASQRDETDGKQLRPAASAKHESAQIKARSGLVRLCH